MVVSTPLVAATLALSLRVDPGLPLHIDRLHRLPCIKATVADVFTSSRATMTVSGFPLAETKFPDLSISPPRIPPPSLDRHNPCGCWDLGSTSVLVTRWIVVGTSQIDLILAEKTWSSLDGVVYHV
ncbi:hypothetical protein F5B18DRAFT_566324 [Nemania serpens]|nr:hypothetical protein F5B18DRAFT_566324 [Nemania serpens]